MYETYTIRRSTNETLRSGDSQLMSKQILLVGGLVGCVLTANVCAAEPRQLSKELDRKRDRHPRGGEVEPLVIVSDPPAVQMLVPGFSVRELPVELTNINNLRYRHDGKLYALGYNGNINLLSDTDGDGLEDTAQVFFHNEGRMRGPIGMAVIPPGHALLRDSDGQVLPSARGVVVASKGKVSAILDLDGDEVAEQERVIASGWQEIPQNVDAVAVAIDPADGAIFFSLGTAAYNNAYLLDEAGKSSFDLESVRGTVQRIEPDLSGRSTVCTGVRFLIGMEFDADGELFATDQEGATWLANGNPFDELLHIRPNRHYGFPPRHPKHLSKVFDQPSLFDYRPQHQSTCGMAFNLPRFAGQKSFGPESWRGDLLVTGESRGKLYRTQLVRDADGEYIARNRLIGCLGMLTVDCCLTPAGDLLVACHSGGPDWGTGPEGIGKLFRIRYDGHDLAQPVEVWASGPHEVRISLDRPIDPAILKGIGSKIKIIAGEYVAAGDRFESIRPGYAVTQLQQSLPRYRLPVYSVSLAADRQTLILSTAEHGVARRYAVTLPGFGRSTQPRAEGDLVQHDEVDLAYSLTGVQADWTSADGASTWSGWLPHLDLDVSMKLVGDSTGRQLREILERPGSLVLKTSIDTRGLFAPAIQPGSKIDYKLADDAFVRRRSVEISVSHNGASEIDRIEHLFTADDDPRAIELTLPTGSGAVQIRSRWHVTCADGTAHQGALALHRFVLPWVRDQQVDSLDVERAIPQLAGASWGRGRRVFASDQAGCAKCHLAGGGGTEIGPDLSNLIHRDYVSVLRDITKPSYAINPDFITYTGVLADGGVLTGALREESQHLIFGDKEGRVTKVRRDQITDLKPATVSVMPEGIAKTLGQEKLNDLLMFLLTPPPTMPLDSPLPPPPPRTRGEVAKVLRGSNDRNSHADPINILLVAGKKDHGPGEHDYPAWLRVWGELLRGEPGVTVETAMEWPTEEQIAAADTIAFFQKGSWTDRRATAIDRHLAKGGGLVYIHWAVEAGERAPEFAKRIGLASNAAQLKYRHGPLELGFRTGSNHPIGRNFDQVHFHDESYWLMKGARDRIDVIGSGVEDGSPRPLFWTLEPSAGRVFVSIPGHYSWTFDDPLFRVLLLRGIAWTARQPVDRFNGLATLGVELRN
jgi:putative heme-binding domain-containing protein